MNQEGTCRLERCMEATLVNCEICGGEMKDELTTYTLLYQGKLIVIENVPAGVCSRCGEKFFSPDTVERLQQTVWEQQRPKQTLRTLVYDLAAS